MESGKTILIIDDEVDILGALGFFLRRRRMEVLTAENGLDALTIIQAARIKPDLIILDVNMPIMNAKEFLDARKARNIEPSIPVILLSSEVWEENELEVIDHVSKPFELMNMMERIDFHLKQVTNDVLNVVDGKSKTF